jgi:L-seryl-tRNA(Ser) seleniumtransferase
VRILAIGFSSRGHQFIREGKTVTGTRLPQVDRILREPELSQLSERFRRDLLVQLVREELANLRKLARDDDKVTVDALTQAIAAKVVTVAKGLLRPSLYKVINGTGVVLNTNLGRAPLSPHVLSDLCSVASGYCNLEIDLQSGKRGQRSQHIQRLLTLLTGAEAAMVVNNNAAAVLLTVHALARDKKVVVSRGELIEIGGSFRLPDVIETAGGILCEVGTTNRTGLDDYRKVLDDSCGLLLRCHRSNFQIQGFTASASLQELCGLAEKTGVPLLEDLGSGVLSESAATAAAGEPTVDAVVASGCDLVSFSGDKLLGGPQCGFIVGKSRLVERLRKHPLYRALRPDKIMLTLVERTLAAYLSPHPQESIPVLAMLSTALPHLQVRAEKVAATICDALPQLRCRAVPTLSAAGGGSLPGEEMGSYGLEFIPEKISVNKLAELMRSGQPPVIGTIQSDRYMLDFRTISESDEQQLVELLTSLSHYLG